MPRFKSPAVCIRHLDWSETSQVVVLLTETHGKIRGLAKGSRRLSPGAVSRFSGGIALLTLGEVVCTTRPSSDLASITEWDLLDPYHYLHSDLSAQWTAMYAADLTNAFVSDLDPHPQVFSALVSLLERLAEPSLRGTSLLGFQWQLLEVCGYRPELDRDAKADRPLRKLSTYTFDAHAGGLTCAAAVTTDHRGPGPWRVRRETVELLRATAKGEIDGSAEALERANRLLCVFIRSILDQPLPTMPFVLGQW